MTSVAIIFVAIPEPGDYVRIKARSKAAPYDIITCEEVFQGVRVFAGECGIMDTVNDQASAYAAAFYADYPDFLVLIPDANEVIVSLPVISPYSEITEVEIFGAFSGSAVPVDHVDNTIHIIRFTPKKYNDLPVLGRYLMTEVGQFVLIETNKKIKI